MKTKKKLTFLFIIIVMAALFAGCGSTSGTLTIVLNDDGQTWQYVDVSTNEVLEFETLEIEGLSIASAAYSDQESMIIFTFGEQSGGGWQHETFSLPINSNPEYTLRGNTLTIHNAMLAQVLGR
ncbi:MAG: hypothetical protein FWD03_03820 [Defluviitaleaceae bacterium]|nr:hypothetical protein [Defluviitaleaceae bacterium]